MRREQRTTNYISIYIPIPLRFKFLSRSLYIFIKYKILSNLIPERKYLEIGVKIDTRET